MKSLAIFFVFAFELFCLLHNQSLAATKEKKSNYLIECSAEYFKDYEKLAKQEVVFYRLGERYRANLIQFVSLLHQYKRSAKQFCNYSSNDYLALLVKATNTLKHIRESEGPFPPHTFGYFAESRLNQLWSDGFRSGWNGFPKSQKQLQCLQKGSVLQTLKQCEKLNQEFFAAIRSIKMPKDW